MCLMMRFLFVFLPVFASSLALSQSFGPECSHTGTFEFVQDTSKWADDCFVASHGRYPESNMRQLLLRDIDLDGDAEVLEVTGYGKASKQIYVFDEIQKGFLYLGRLNAQPNFEVFKSEEGEPLIRYVHRFGWDDYVEITIGYVDQEFVTLGRKRLENYLDEYLKDDGQKP